MFLWQIWLIIAIIVLIADFFTATMFFVNISLAFFLTSIVAYFGGNLYWQLGTLAVSSALFLMFLYPLMKNKLQKTNYVDFTSKYVGAVAKVVVPVTAYEGRIAVFGEEWSAVSTCEEEIPVGTQVKIIEHKGLTMIVEKI